MKRIIIVDQNNMFLRHYIVDPSLSLNGDPIGGLQGSIKGLQKFLRDLKPDMVVICWDGSGGSKKRKQLNKNYKAGRSPVRLNRVVKNIVNEQQELENKIWQMTRLSEYYDTFPLVQFLLDNVEADDIISQVAQLEDFKDHQKIVISSDKDFIQLLDNKTILFRPIQKQILSLNNVVEEYGIHPNNFTIARSMVGDVSDNLPGIKGVGLKTIAKRLPFLARAKGYTITEIIKECKDLILEDEKKKPPKVYQDIISSKKIISDNYKMMQLSVPSIGVRGKEYIKRTIDSFEPQFNKTEFRRMMLKDGFVEWNWDTLFQTFNKFVISKK